MRLVRRVPSLGHDPPRTIVFDEQEGFHGARDVRVVFKNFANAKRDRDIAEHMHLSSPFGLIE